MGLPAHCSQTKTTKPSNLIFLRGERENKHMIKGGTFKKKKASRKPPPNLSAGKSMCVCAAQPHSSLCHPPLIY